MTSNIRLMILKVLFYYRLPEEEQALQKNPMCWAFPRLGRVYLLQSLTTSWNYEILDNFLGKTRNENTIHGLSASCNYWRWGPGGMQENINAICVLALNMINDKVTFYDNSIHSWMVLIRFVEQYNFFIWSFWQYFSDLRSSTQYDQW